MSCFSGCDLLRPFSSFRHGKGPGKRRRSHSAWQPRSRHSCRSRRTSGRMVSKKELIAKVWPDLVVDEGSLRFHVLALRKALGQEQSSSTRYVTNVSGRGYCFVAPISRAASQPEPLRNSLAHSPIGLPPCPTKMVGRDETVRFISEELTARRFLTIVGSGGIGKTTLAAAVSHTMLAAFDGAVHYVDFGPICTPSLLPNRVALTVGLPGNLNDPLAALPAFLRDRRMLLVLDSCE